MEHKKFTKRQESFLCDHCGHEVLGDGYTNHCSACLWSKHVDVYPGDRAEKCFGLMKPCAVGQRSGQWVLTHECQRCHFQRKQTVHSKDNFDTIIAIAREQATR